MDKRAKLWRADNSLTWEEVRPSAAKSSLADDLRKGLFSKPRSLPPKYFYDATGSTLFERICDRPEYYLTRTEDSLLARHAPEIIDIVRPHRIVEFGSGASRKTRRLLDACHKQGCFPTYAPFDVCQTMLVETGRLLIQEHRWLRVQALVGDYSAGLAQLPANGGTDLLLFLGSTIGNFEEPEALEFLSELHTFMDDGDWLLIGADRIKPPHLLHAAYNDAAGLTACFNLNMLRVINKRSGTNFDLETFHHYAYFNPLARRIEMYLLPSRPQRVCFPLLGETLHLAEGEPIRTEISRKFTHQGLEQLLSEAGFRVELHYETEHPAFSLALARPARGHKGGLGP
ncbi:MAG: L-histidine N(alpha)-methyltransferase [Gammaproteobacteria bacterium]